jgi:hypothetical protein
LACLDEIVKHGRGIHVLWTRYPKARSSPYFGP